MVFIMIICKIVMATGKNLQQVIFAIAMTAIKRATAVAAGVLICVAAIVLIIVLPVMDVIHAVIAMYVLRVKMADNL